MGTTQGHCCAAGGLKEGETLDSVDTQADHGVLELKMWMEHSRAESKECSDKLSTGPPSEVDPNSAADKANEANNTSSKPGKDEASVQEKEETASPQNPPVQTTSAADKANIDKPASDDEANQISSKPGKEEALVQGKEGTAAPQDPPVQAGTSADAALCSQETGAVPSRVPRPMALTRAQNPADQKQPAPANPESAQQEAPPATERRKRWCAPCGGNSKVKD